MPSRNKGGRKKPSRKQKPPPYKQPGQMVAGSEEPEGVIGPKSSSPPVGFDGSDCVTVPDSWEDLDGIAQPPETDSGPPSAAELMSVEVNAAEASAPRYAEGEGSFNTVSSKDSSQELIAEDDSQELEDELLAARQQQSTMGSGMEYARRVSSTQSDQLATVQEADFAKANGLISEANIIAGENERVLKHKLALVQGEYESLQDNLSRYAEENKLLKEKIKEHADEFNDVDHLQDELQQANEKWVEIAAELSTAKETIARHVGQLEDLFRENQESEARVKELEDYNAELLGSAPQKEQALNELVEKNERLEVQISNYASEIDEYAISFGKLKEENSLLLSTMTTKDAALMENASVIENLSLEIDSLRSLNAHMESEFNSGKEMTEQYSQEIAKLKGEILRIEQSHGTASSLESMLESSKEEMEAVRSKLKAAVKKGKRIEQEKISLEAQCNEYKKEIDSTHSDLQELKKQLSSEKMELESRHSDSIAELERQLAEANEAVAISEKSKQDLEGKLRAAVKKGMKIEQTRNELDAKVMEHEEASARQTTHISALEEEINELKAQDYVGIQHRAAQAEELADKLTTDMEVAQQTLHAKSNELLAALATIENTKSELANVSEKLQSVEVENASLKVKCANALECNSRAEKAEGEKAQLEGEMVELRTKVNRARDAIEKMRHEKETLVIQVEELSESVSQLEIENADLHEICELSQGNSRTVEDNKPAVDPDLDDWVHRALHAEKRAAEAEALRQKENGILQDKLNVAERNASLSMEKLQNLENDIRNHSSESSATELALATATTQLEDLESRVISFQAEIERLEALNAELTIQQQELEHLKENSNPPIHGPNFVQEVTSDVQAKIHTAHEAARCLALQLNVPFYETSGNGDDSKLDAVRILLEGVGFGMQQKSLKMEDLVQRINLMAGVHKELEAANSERDRLTHELAKYKRMSSGSIDITSSLIETVPSALGQPVAAKKRRDVHDIEAGIAASEIEEDDDDRHSDFMPLTAAAPLKNAPANVIYGLTLLDRGYLSAAKSMGGKPLMRVGIAVYFVVLHILALVSLI